VLGRRVSKTIDGQTTQFLYDGNDIVAEMQSGVVTAFYLRGLNIDEPFIRITATGNEYYHPDALGSVLALTNTAGQVTTTYAYEPFGTTTQTGPSANPFQYTGRENNGTGQYYYRARYYSPKLQRFIGEDLVNFAASVEWNGYLYVENNPITRIDPLGLWYIDAGAGFPLFAGGTGVVLGLQGGPAGIFAYGGLGFGVGKAASITLMSGSPVEGVSAKVTAQGGGPLPGIRIPVGAKASYSIDTQGNESMKYGIGVGFGFNASFLPVLQTKCFVFCKKERASKSEQ
jgi:RHS repeat-associated protein